MKKLSTYLLLLMMAVASLSMTSCSKEELAQKSMPEVLSEDIVFENAVKASLELTLLAKENNWQANAEQIKNLLDKIAAGDAASETELTNLLGMTKEAYYSQLESFGEAIVNLNNKYPELNQMSATEKQSVYATAIAGNEALQQYVTEMQEQFRGCLVQDICTGIVTLAALIGGPFLCDAIAGAVPIIGPLLCNLVLDIAQDLLNGICMALPC
ncbi:MAG: hypothetical protein R2730_15700 [Chitinophagales bacterium]